MNTIPRASVTEPEPTGRVVTRIAPSPTGSFHIGTARTALFNYLFAKRNGGSFIVRFEDTDRERSEKRYETEAEDSLRWLGLIPDGVYRQSERGDIYARHIARLLESGAAYLSREPSKGDPSRETEVVRFRNADPKVSFTDTVRGEITMDTADLGDFVIARSGTDPLYNLAVVIDDIGMGVTHVMRGDDHISNTPRQILLTRALGASPPVYTHIPLIHSPAGGKLSKRKDATAVREYRDRGYLPEAVVNAIALLGWHPPDDRELFTMEELIAAFSPERIQKKEAVFDERKMLWCNRHFVQHIPEDRLRGAVVPTVIERFPLRSRLNPRAVRAVMYDIRDRGMLFGDACTELREGSHDFYFTAPAYPVDMLVPKKKDVSGDAHEDTHGDARDRETAWRTVAENLHAVRSVLAPLGAYGGWTEETVRDAVMPVTEERGKSEVLWPLRVALSGREKSPGPFAIAAVIGKGKTMLRIRRAVERIRSAHVI